MFALKVHYQCVDECGLGYITIFLRLVVLNVHWNRAFYNVSIIELKIYIKVNKSLFHRMHIGRVPILAFTELLIPVKLLSLKHAWRRNIEKLPYSVLTCTLQPSCLLILLMEDPVPSFSHKEDLFFIIVLNSFHLLARIFLGATASS